MCVCVCVCVCVYIDRQIEIDINRYRRVSSKMRACVRAYGQAGGRACMHACVCVGVDVCACMPSSMLVCREDGGGRGDEGGGRREKGGGRREERRGTKHDCAGCHLPTRACVASVLLPARGSSRQMSPTCRKKSPTYRAKKA